MIPKGKGLPKFADDATLNQIRGKAMVGHQTLEDTWTLLDHLQLIEHVLDEDVDTEDGLGTEGWRHHMEAVGAQRRGGSMSHETPQLCDRCREIVAVWVQRMLESSRAVDAVDPVVPSQHFPSTRAEEITLSSCQPCGCDLKASWICEQHR